MKKTLLFLLAVALSTNTFAQIYMANNCEISFFSKTPVEDIAAINKAAKPLINIATGDVQIKILMSAFVFEKPLMQEHFNENYVESEKKVVVEKDGKKTDTYPNRYAIFIGKINEKIDFTKDGEYKATVTGKLTIHGIEKDRTIEGIIKVERQQISISSTFKIIFADHNIEIPRLYSGIIPADTEVKLKATLEPFKKS